MSVFVDTSALYALLDRDDDAHGHAAAAFPELLEHEHLVTHNYVVVEMVALVQRRLELPAVRTLTQDLLPALETVWVTPEVHAAASGSLLAGLRRRPSLVDWVSFELMRRLDIETAFAFDADFAAQGFHTVP